VREGDALGAAGGAAWVVWLAAGAGGEAVGLRSKGGAVAEAAVVWRRRHLAWRVSALDQNCSSAKHGQRSRRRRRRPWPQPQKAILERAPAASACSVLGLGAPSKRAAAGGSARTSTLKPVRVRGTLPMFVMSRSMPPFANLGCPAPAGSQASKHMQAPIGSDYSPGAPLVGVGGDGREADAHCVVGRPRTTAAESRRSTAASAMTPAQSQVPAHTESREKKNDTGPRTPACS